MCEFKHASVHVKFDAIHQNIHHNIHQDTLDQQFNDKGMLVKCALF